MRKGCLCWLQKVDYWPFLMTKPNMTNTKLQPFDRWPLGRCLLGGHCKPVFAPTTHPLPKHPFPIKEPDLPWQNRMKLDYKRNQRDMAVKQPGVPEKQGVTHSTLKGVKRDLSPGYIIKREGARQGRSDELISPGSVQQDTEIFSYSPFIWNLRLFFIAGLFPSACEYAQ